MAKKYIQDSILTNDRTDVSVIASALSNTVGSIYKMEAERFASEPIPLYSNIEAVSGDGESAVTNWGLSQFDDGSISFDIPEHSVATFTSNAIVAVAVWADETTGVIAQEEGEPLKRIQALYILSLPTTAQALASGQLKEYVAALLERDLLAKARGIAKKMEVGADGFTLVADPVGMFLAATTKAASRETAYNRMWTTLQAIMLKVADGTVQALKARGNHSDARQVQATFARSRLNKETLKACLSSHEAASYHFPTMVTTDPETGAQTSPQWDALIKKLLSHAPKHAVRKIIKDADGQPILDLEGNKTYDRVAAPQSPAIFAYWLENRYTTEDTQEHETIEVDFTAIDM